MKFDIKGVAMTTRILIFEDDDAARNMLSIFLRAKGYEVLDFPTPATCTLISENKCQCPRSHACADMIITDMNMPGMSGLELVRYQMERGCRIPIRNKAVISAALTPEDEREFHALGCRCLRKPFKLNALLAWVQSVEANIPPERRLTPLPELFKSVSDRMAQ